MDDLDLEPATIEDARKTIKVLLERLLNAQEIAIDRGNKLIALNEEKLHDLSGPPRGPLPPHKMQG